MSATHQVLLKMNTQQKALAALAIIQSIASFVALGMSAKAQDAIRKYLSGFGIFLMAMAGIAVFFLMTRPVIYGESAFWGSLMDGASIGGVGAFLVLAGMFVFLLGFFSRMKDVKSNGSDEDVEELNNVMYLTVAISVTSLALFLAVGMLHKPVPAYALNALNNKLAN